MWIDEIILINESGARNSNGFTVKTEGERRTVFGNKKSVRGSEFYLSSSHGFRIDAVFEVKKCDYQGEKLLEFEKKKYKVIRDYEIPGEESIELSVTDITEEKN